MIWRDHALRLGYNKEFRLLAHLARRANQYVTHVDLLEEIVSYCQSSIDCVKDEIRREESEESTDGSDE